MKYVLLCYLALVGQVIFPRILGAQQKVHPSDPIKTKDQMLAEAMWRLAGLDAEKDVRADDVFDEVSKALPRSAKVAYWHAKFRALDGQQVEVLQKIVDFSQSLQQQMKSASGSDLSTDQLLYSAELSANEIGQSFRGRLESLKNNHQENDWEAMMLKAVALDPKLTAAWGALLESEHPKTANMAIAAWCELEPDNCVPYYHHAFKLASTSFANKEKQEFDFEVLKVLEQGNKRTKCLIPLEPWPIDFTVLLGTDLPKDMAGQEGKPIDRDVFCSLIQNHFDCLGAIGGGDPSIPNHSLDFLQEYMVTHFKSMTFENRCRCLQAFIELGLHLVDSNKFVVGLLTQRTEDVALYAENLATQFGDFRHAEEFHQIGGHLRDVRYALARAYRELEHNQKFTLGDQISQQTMSSMRKSFQVPRIEKILPPPRLPVISSAFGASEDMVLLDVYLSADGDYYVNVKEETSVEDRLDNKALERKGYLSLHSALERVQERNREQRRRCGVVLVNDHFLVGDTGAMFEAFYWGYWGMDSLCIFASSHEDRLKSLTNKWKSYLVSSAHIIGRGPMLRQEDQEQFSKHANLLVIPYGRVLDSNSEVLPWLQESPWKLILAGIPGDEVERWKAMDLGPSVVGLLLSPSE